MKIRVKPGAVKGHRVGDALIPPGGTLPGDWDRVPPTLAHVLEEVPAKAMAQDPSPRPVPEPPIPPPFPPFPEPEEPGPEPEEPDLPIKRPRGRPPGSGRFAKVAR